MTYRRWGNGDRWVIRRITDMFHNARYWVLPPHFQSGPVLSFATFEEARAAFASGGAA